MAAHTQTSTTTVKANIDGDVRRIQVTLPVSAADWQTFQKIRAAVADGFGLDEACLPVLKYRDEDGDLCTLVEVSVQDMLVLANGGTLHVFGSTAQKVANSGWPLEHGYELVAAEPALKSAADADVANVVPAQAADSTESVLLNEEVAVDATDDELAVPNHTQQPEDEPFVKHGTLTVLTAMGFGEDLALAALVENNGNIFLAVDSLITNLSVEAQTEVRARVDEVISDPALLAALDAQAMSSAEEIAQAAETAVAALSNSACDHDEIDVTLDGEPVILNRPLHAEAELQTEHLEDTRARLRTPPLLEMQQTVPQRPAALEPHAGDTVAGARWARLAQAAWYCDEAHLRLQLAHKQQEWLGARIGLDRTQDAIRLVAGPHDLMQAANAYNLMYECPAGGRILTATWKGAAAALRNNVAMRLCCQQGSCSLAAFQAEMLRIYGPSRVGNQGSDLDLRAQLMNSHARIFPGFQNTRKRKRLRKRPGNLEIDGGVLADTAMQIEEGSGGSAGEGHDDMGTSVVPPQRDERDVLSIVRNGCVHFLYSSEDGSQGKHSSQSCPQLCRTSFRTGAESDPPVEQAQDDGNSIALLGILRAQMPTVAEECETPVESLVAFARTYADSRSHMLQKIFECLMMDSDDFLQTMRPLLTEFKSKALAECCVALGRFACDKKGIARSSEVVELLLAPLADASDDEDVRSACLDAILQISREIEEVLSVPGARKPETQLSDEVRAQLGEVVGPLAKCGASSEKAAQILGRTLPLDSILQTIGSSSGGLINTALSEIFDTLEKVIYWSYYEDDVPEKEWACKLLSELSKQRQNVLDSRFQLAWIRAGHTRDKQIHRIILLGLLFPPTMLVNIFEKAVDALDQDLMGTTSIALQTINDSLGPLTHAQCDSLAHLVLKVELSSLHRVCRSDLITVLGSIMRSREDELFNQVLKQIASSANEFMYDRRGSSFDFAVVWSLEGFVQHSANWVQWEEEIFNLCAAYVQKWRDRGEGEQENKWYDYNYNMGDQGQVVELAKKILAHDAHDGHDAYEPHGGS